MKIKSNINILIFLVVFLVGLLILFFNESGIFKYLGLKSEVKSLKEQIDKRDKENKMLQGEIDSLRNEIPAKIEQVAREKYNMKRKNEKVIKIQKK
jgi:cell division protein FtsL